MAHSFLFDIGNVILFFDFSVAVRRIAARCQLPEADILPSITKLTEAFERGEMDTASFATAAAEQIGFSGEPGELVTALEDIFTVNEPMVELIENLSAKGHPLFLLSNTNAIHVPYFTGRYSVFDHFEGATYSHEVGAMKPSPDIYQSAISSHNLDPATTIYVDDVAANVDAGREAGLQGICYDGTEHNAFLSELKSIGEKIS